MVKVHILSQCEQCQGAAYVPVGEANSYSGETYIQHKPCPGCQGSGRQEKWVSLKTFVEMLEKALQEDLLEPNWLVLAQEEPTSLYQDSRDAAGIG